MFKCTAVYHAIQSSSAKVIVLQGGTSSSKTISALQDAIVYAIYNPGKVITVTGQSMPNLKKGAYRDVEWLYANSAFFQSKVQFWNKTEKRIYFFNGTVMEFITNLDEQSAKAGKRDMLIVDEANGLSWPVFFQMAIRTRGKIIITYNPSASFWAHEKLIHTTPESNDLSATVEFIISDHRHNCFLTEDEHRKIEGIKDKQLWAVYARGITGNLTGLIYPNWKQIPDSEYPDVDFFAGLDFGYSQDPTALVKIAVVGNNVFLHELCYETGIPAQRIKEICAVNKFTKDNIIYCEHDKEQIIQLRRLGLQAIPANKGNGSIKGGILKMNEFNVYYTASSKNLHEERTHYMWEIDKDTGKPTNTPKAGMEHLLDGARYGIFTKYFRQGI